MSNTATQNTSLDCYGDCDTTAVNVFGGTPPYSIAFGGGASTIIDAFDSIYSNLCAGNYNINVTDVNGCSVDGSSPTSTTVNGLNHFSP